MTKITKVSKAPFLGPRRQEGEDLLILTTSFERRCAFAVGSGAQANFRAREAILLEYESNTPDHRRRKELHRTELERHLGRVVGSLARIERVETSKYDVLQFIEDLEPQLRSRTYEYVTVDITAFTKCTLVALLSLIFRRNPATRLRCVWTPGLYGNGMELTHGVKKTFVVPGFGGIGREDCRVLVLFLGQESSRAYSLWRATDPDLLYMVAGESEYSRVSAQDTFRSMVNLRVFSETETFVVDGTEPEESFAVLSKIEKDLRMRGYEGDVAIGCLGTKVELLGVWSFLQNESASSRMWHYVYAVPGEYAKGKTLDEYVRELTEVEIRTV